MKPTGLDVVNHVLKINLALITGEGKKSASYPITPISRTHRRSPDKSHASANALVDRKPTRRGGFGVVLNPDPLKEVLEGREGRFEEEELGRQNMEVANVAHGLLGRITLAHPKAKRRRRVKGDQLTGRART